MKIEKPKRRCVNAHALQHRAYRQQIVKNARVYDRKRDKREIEL